MKRIFASLLFFASLFLAAQPASAVVIDALTIDMVSVGNAGNVADFANGGYGTVGDLYNIGKYEVTTGQYTTFLNAVAAADPYELYNTNMATAFPTFGIQRIGSPESYSYSTIGNSNAPVSNVSWGDAARFSNWLQNGQPNGPVGGGTTETGAYSLNGATSNEALMAVTRNAGATVFLPSENEWYKAAYYKGESTNAGYWRLPMQSNGGPTNVLSATDANSANYYFNGNYTDPTNYLTTVGAFAASPSHYGTFDQGGNVLEWNESSIPNINYRSSRGGSFSASDGSNALLSSSQYGHDPTYESNDLGFRVATVPEPCTAVLAGVACGLMWVLRKRFKRPFAAIANAKGMSTQTTVHSA